MLDQVILWAFLAATAVQLFFWLFFFARLAFFKVPPLTPRGLGASSPPSPLTSPPVSIVICARNEAGNLREHLYRILNQTYRSYEVLLVNHKSSDETREVLQSLQRTHKHLRIVNCDDARQGKKFALAFGIERATHQVLLLTDADCRPASDQWLSGMVSGLDENTQIVLGVSPYEEAPGFLNKFVRYEACWTATQYLGFALAGIPYMGVGRNLAYRRELFQRTGGFRSHEHLASGDDDLFVNEAAEKGGVGIRLNPQTFTYSKPKSSWQAFFRQKKRHYSTGKRYKLHHQLLLALLAVSHGLHYILGASMLALKISIIIALLGYAVRMCVVVTLSCIILSKLQCRSLRLWLPVLDVALVVHYCVFAPLMLMNTSTHKWS